LFFPTGKEFKKLLVEAARRYDQELSKTIEMVAGKEFVAADRNVFILKSALRDLTKIPNFPKEDSFKINTNLSMVELNNPMIERLNYYNSEKAEEKNNNAKYIKQ